MSKFLLVGRKNRFKSMFFNPSCASPWLMVETGFALCLIALWSENIGAHVRKPVSAVRIDGGPQTNYLRRQTIY